MIKLNSSGFLSATTAIKVPFFDVDMAGIVWHGHYFKYFELARCELLEGIDYSYREMQRSGFLWPLVDTSIRYVNPLILDQQVFVTACLREWELRIVIDYEIRDERDAICTKGKTVQVPVDAETHLLQLGSPEVLVNNVQDYMKTHRDMGSELK